MKAESPRDRRLVGLGVELFDKPRRVPTKSLAEGDVFVVGDSPLAKAFIVTERHPDGSANCAAVGHDGQVQQYMRWEKLHVTDVPLIGRLT